MQLHLILTIFNNKVVITRCLMQYWQIFFWFFIVPYYVTRVKVRFSYGIGSLNKLPNMRNSENISRIALGTVR